MSHPNAPLEDDTNASTAAEQQDGLSAEELESRFSRGQGRGDTDEHLPAQEPEGEAMGSVRASRRPDPITGKPLYEDDATGASSNAMGDAYRSPADRGVEEESKRPATGTPSSTPRREKGLREF